jgi:protein-S-isoprenylcysteine O-methyltransferase Ste14
MLIGVLLVLAAVALFMSSVRTFGKAGTPVPGNLPTTIIVRTGTVRLQPESDLSRFSRSFSFGDSQHGSTVSACWSTLLPALALMVLVVVPREERYLEARFPAEYLPYKRDVRRWL